MILAILIVVIIAALVAAMLNDRRPAPAESEPDWEDGE